MLLGALVFLSGIVVGLLLGIITKQQGLDSNYALTGMCIMMTLGIAIILFDIIKNEPIQHNSRKII